MDIKVLNFLEEEYYIYLIAQEVEVKQVEEKIINKLRNNKRKVEKVYKMIKNSVNIENDVVDSETLK